MKLTAKYSSSTFYPERSATINQAGGKPTSGGTGYGPMNFMEGAPFGNSDWVKQKAEPKSRDKKH